MYEYEELEQYTLVKAKNGHMALKRCTTYRRANETWGQAQAREPAPQYANLAALDPDHKNEFVQTFKNEPPGQYPIAGFFFDQIPDTYDCDFDDDWYEYEHWYEEDEHYYYDDDWGSH